MVTTTASCPCSVQSSQHRQSLETTLRSLLAGAVTFDDSTLESNAVAYELRMPTIEDALCFNGIPWSTEKISEPSTIDEPANARGSSA